MGCVGALLAFSLLDVVGAVVLAATFVLVIWKIEKQRGKRPQSAFDESSFDIETDNDDAEEIAAEFKDNFEPEQGKALGKSQNAMRPSYVPMLPPRSVRRRKWWCP
jgi:hypothetical protein